MSGAEPTEPVRVQIRFERFPVALRGAFVMRGGDGDPHSVRFESTRVERIPAGPAKTIQMEDRLIDLAPTRDLFVPFEVPIMELEPSWYRVRCSLRVDGARSCEFLGRPFTVPWPRSEIRKGTVAVERTVPLGRGEARIERIECGWDSSVVVWRAAAALARDVQAVVLADGVALETLPPEAAPKLGEASDGDERRTVGYPVPKPGRSLAVVLRRGQQQLSEPAPASA